MYDVLRYKIVLSIQFANDGKIKKQLTVSLFDASTLRTDPTMFQMKFTTHGINRNGQTLMKCLFY